MNYRNGELLEQLAAEYALGTLRGAARLRFERLLPQHPDALAAVRRWEDRFVQLAGGLAPVQPGAAVWRQVQQRLNHTPARSFAFLGWWNASRLALAAAVAAVMIAVTLQLTVFTPSSRLLAIVATEQQAEWWRVETRDDHEALRVIASAAVAADMEHAYELWALPDSGAAPVSLGLMPQGGAHELVLSAAQRAALQQASKIAVSLEPPGGSPTGAPGQVLFVADVVRSG